MSEVDVTDKIDNNNSNPIDSSNNNNNNVVPTKDENSDISHSSGVSSVSSKSKLSGIKPPSRIGRPCGGIQKPAVPTTPTKNSSDDSIRRLTDDYGRHRLSDLVEADESEEDDLRSRRKRYYSIGSTASSMDGLWDLHPRRLSEAGLSRHSDSSAVLTEDTDSFMIGQRVWVGGTKPGTIAYIGETQFAPGEWAGIALDEPIGKNDGSVAGIRYFQCENKKGVFSRLTRLTRVPLEQPGMGSNETFVTPSNGIRRSPISPTGSTKSLLKSPTLSNSNTSLASTVDFKIGDRVIIKSTQGSKVGTVKYMGLTDFAPGEWVGVELDDPRGKNDGSVEGKRYFECRPRFGLFAPISKVSKSPSKYKPGACVVHSGPGLPPSGLKKTNSKESLNSSVASSVRRVRLGVTSLTPKKTPMKTTATPIPTRTALQDVLREKQQHIEQLLKERDLERAEITRAASQADEAEQQLFNLKQEYEKYRLQSEIKVRENTDLLSQLRHERDELLSQLEDEKRRNEDLQFRFEEAAITKSDIEATNEIHIRKISELEKTLADERQKAENSETTSNKLFEAEENLIKAREEIDGLKCEYHDTKKKKEEEIEALRDEHTKRIDAFNGEISKMKTKHEAAMRNIEEKCAKQSSEIEELKCKLAKTDELLKEKQNLIETLEQKTSELAKENDKLKMELSAKSLDLETATEKIAQKENEYKSAQQNQNATHSELTQKIAELERHKQNQEEVEANLKRQLEETRGNLKQKMEETENLSNDLNAQLSQKDTKLQEANSTISQKNQEIEKMHLELTETKTKFEEIKNEIRLAHERQMSEQHSQLTSQAAEIQQKNEEITRLTTLTTKLEEDLCSKTSVIETSRLELEKERATHTEACSSLEAKWRELELRNGELGRELAMIHESLNAQKAANQQLQQEIQVLTTSSRPDDAEQMEQMREEINAKSRQIEAIRAEFLEKINQAERAKHEVEMRYEQVVAEHEKIKGELGETLKVKSEVEEEFKKHCDTSTTENAKIREEFTSKIGGFEQVLQQKDMDLANLRKQLEETEQQLRITTEETKRSMEKSEEKIRPITDENVRLKEELAKKAEEIIEANSRVSKAQALQQQMEQELKYKFEEECKKIQTELNKSSEEKIRPITEENARLKEELAKKAEEIIEANSRVTNAQALQQQIEHELKQKFEEECKKIQIELNKSNEEKIRPITDENMRLKEELAKKAEEIIEANSRFGDAQALQQQIEHELKQKFEEECKKIQSELNEKAILLEKLQNENHLLQSDCQNTNVDLSAKNEQISQLLSDVQVAQALVKQLQEELTTTQSIQQQTAKEREEMEKLHKSLLEQVAVLTEKVQTGEGLFKSLQTEHEKFLQVLNHLKITEEQKQECLRQLQQVGDGSKSSDRLKDFLIGIKTENDQNAIMILNLKQDIETWKNQYAQKNQQFEAQKNEILKLQELLIQAREANKKSDGDAPVNNSLIEDKELAANQIAFLNSIIVDIQKKNEEQKARIEILEKGYSPAEADEFKVLGLTGQRQIPPRMYCDICEEFDLHETDECPQQATELAPSKGHQAVQERPYCEICEAFGHATEDCQEDQTF